MNASSFYFHSGVKDVRKVWEAFKAFLKEMRASGGAEVVVKKYRKNKSDQQRKYAHMCIGIIAKEVGERPEHLKIRIKHSIGLIEEIYSNGKVITVERSTEDLSRDEYGMFINTIKTLSMNLNIVLPEPNWYGMECAA